MLINEILLINVWYSKDILFLFFVYFGWLINGKNCFLEWNIIIYYYDLFSDILLNFKIIGWF